MRKLESRLLASRHALELQQRCTQLKAQADALAHAQHEAEARAAAAEAAAAAAALDVACLKRGLELAAEQLTKSAGAEVPGTLLRAVARASCGRRPGSFILGGARAPVGRCTAVTRSAATPPALPPALELPLKLPLPRCRARRRR